MTRLQKYKLIRLSSRCLCFVLTLVMSSQVLSDVVLKGFVSLDRERGEPVSGVEIYGDGANVVTTDNAGRFILIFPNGHPGQNVRLTVKYTGFSVVNDILLDYRLPDSTSRQPFEIIICKNTEREQRVAEFYRLKGYETIELNYRAKLAELETRQATTEKEYNRIRRERDQARQDVKKWAQKFAMSNPKEITGSYREALRYFLDNEYDKALQILTEERLQQEADKAQEQVNQVVKSWLLKGELLIMRLDFKGASQTYKKLVSFAPNSIDAWHAYAELQHRQQNLTEAQRGYKKALFLARQGSNTEEIIIAIYRLALAYSHDNKMSESRELYKEAVIIARAQAKNNPGNEQLVTLVSALRGLGRQHYTERDWDEANEAYDESLQILRVLARKEPDIYISKVAILLNDLAWLYEKENRMAEAHEKFKEALKIYRNLSETKPHTYLHDVANTLNSLGGFYRSEERWTEAYNAYKEGLEICKKLAKKEYEGLRCVALILGNLGNTYRDQKRWPEARETLNEALLNYRELAAFEPKIYERYVQHIERALTEMPQ